MRLYLVQHGEALSKDIDPERPMSEKGRNDVRRVAERLRDLAVSVSDIRHSGKARAAQTAGILAESLSDKPAVASDALAPMDDPEIWLARLAETDHDCMLVGHLPHLDRLASLLLACDPASSVVSFRMGGVVALDSAEDGAHWSLRWFLTPELC